MSISQIGGSADKHIYAGSVQVGGSLELLGSVSGVSRESLTQENLAVYPLLPESWKVHDDLDTPLPSTPATDDLGLIGGTFGSATPSLQTEDLKAAGATTNYARRTFALPPEYQAGQTVVLRLHAGMLTTVADATALLDAQVYLADREAGVDGGDLCATAAQSCNNLVLADLDFTITATALAPGDLLDIRIATTVTDAATATAVKAIVAAVELLLDIKGCRGEGVTGRGGDGVRG
jgi:hypothetical protein